ncbi:MAG: carboxypeptidase-like regulatory domain-containing protein, partial [Acidobacteriota bacterium]
MGKTVTTRLALLTGAAIFVGAMALVRARPLGVPGGQADAGHVAIDADDSGGVVTSTAGPEAGVWVIAETTELGTKYRKIVVTDDRGRYVIPDLPAATYDVWVRGYGLVDSPHVRATPGKSLALTGVVAPNAVAAAQIYPANYWYSLMQVPPKEAFPINVAPSAAVGTDSGAGPGGFDPGAKPNFETEGAVARKGPPVIKTQAEWVNLLKCTACHQMGNLATRQLSKNLGTFSSSADHWERALRSGQEGVRMLGGVDRFGHERG